MKGVPEELIKLFQKVDNFVLATHSHPDGDALGSLLGLASILEAKGKNVFRYLEEPVSYNFDFLPDASLISTDINALQDFVNQASGNIAAVSLDCGDAKRLGLEMDTLLSIHPFFTIDHHLGHKEFGDQRWIDHKRSSTGEMVYEIAQVLEAEISYNAAVALYTAIATDTGSFRYESTTPRTMCVAAELLAIGVKPDEICGKLYDNFSHARLALLQKVLATLELFEDDQIAFVMVTEKMFADTGATSEDLEGFVNYPRSLRTVKVAVFLKEIMGGGVSVSMRAKGKCDVAKVAALFDGGGHRNAAGFRLFDITMDAIQARILSALQNELRAK